MKRLLIIKKVLPIVLAVILLQSISLADSQAAPPANGGCYHTVRYGETLSSIGWRYGVSTYTIANANGLDNPNYIYAGQVLYIPSGQGYNNYSNYNNNQYQYNHNAYYGNGNKYYKNYQRSQYYPNYQRDHQYKNHYYGHNQSGGYSHHQW